VATCSTTDRYLHSIYHILGREAPSKDRGTGKPLPLDLTGEYSMATFFLSCRRRQRNCWWPEVLYLIGFQQNVSAVYFLCLCVHQ